MGVLIPSSCLITLPTADSGVFSRRSEGKEADFGVWRGGRTGFLVAAIVKVVDSSSSEQVTEMWYDDPG